MPFEPRVSVVVPLKRLNSYVDECLSHLSKQTYSNFDVFVVTDEPESLSEISGLTVTYLASGPVPPNFKRMQAARQSDADLIALIDDDAFPVPTWLESAVRHFADPHVVGVGGPGVTPPNDHPLQQASGAVYSSALVSAGYVYRYLPRATRDVDDYPSCNLVVRRAPFLEAVPNCLKYWPGEDTKLCLLITRGTERIVYEPEAVVFHHRRSIFWGHFRQVWNYAVHRGFFAKRYPETSLRAQYFVPTAFAAGNFAAMFVQRFPVQLRRIVLGLGALYALLIVLAVSRSRGTHHANPVVVAIGIYLTHLTYGVGFAIGLGRSELEH